MNDSRLTQRAPDVAGPTILLALIVVTTAAHVLRSLFAVPVEVPPGALSMDSLQRGEWWTVFTYMFTHRDALHLLTNLLLLLMAGRAVERHAGGRHMLYIYLSGAWGGAMVHLMLRPDSPAVVGASGAVFGTIGAFIALFPEYDLMRPLRGVLPGRLKAKRLFPALLLVHVGLELVRRYLPGVTTSQITDQAHLIHAGGLTAGWLYGRVLAADGSLDAAQWNDFFPQGLRRQSRNVDEAMPVAAGLPSRLMEEEEAAAPEPPHELSDAEFLREQVDPVLEKLYERGAGHLTPEERAVLDEASRRFARRKPS